MWSICSSNNKNKSYLTYRHYFYAIPFCCLFIFNPSIESVVKINLYFLLEKEISRKSKTNIHEKKKKREKDNRSQTDLTIRIRLNYHLCYVQKLPSFFFLLSLSSTLFIEWHSYRKDYIIFFSSTSILTLTITFSLRSMKISCTYSLTIT